MKTLHFAVLSSAIMAGLILQSCGRKGGLEIKSADGRLLVSEVRAVNQNQNNQGGKQEFEEVTVKTFKSAGTIMNINELTKITGVNPGFVITDEDGSPCKEVAAKRVMADETAKVAANKAATEAQYQAIEDCKNPSLTQVAIPATKAMMAAGYGWDVDNTKDGLNINGQAFLVAVVERANANGKYDPGIDLTTKEGCAAFKLNPTRYSLWACNTTVIPTGYKAP